MTKLPLAQYVVPRATMRTLAEAAGVSESHMWRVVNKERTASKRVREAVAAALDIPEAELFGSTTGESGND